MGNFIFSIMTGIMLVTAVTVNTNDNELVCEHDDNIDSLIYYHRIVDSLVKTKSKFDIANKSFKKYNDIILESEVKHFLKVCETFKLDTNPYHFRTYIAQICVESGAKQYYSNGDLVVSSGNAIGMTQIVPNTGYRFLKNVVGTNDSLVISLGGTKYDVILANKMKAARPDVKLWLKDYKNNVILWGYIMRYCMEKTKGDLDKALVMYNQGEGWLRKFIKKKGRPNRFEYVKHINETKGVLSQF